MLWEVYEASWGQECLQKSSMEPHLPLVSLPPHSTTPTVQHATSAYQSVTLLTKWFDKMFLLKWSQFYNTVACHSKSQTIYYYNWGCLKYRAWHCVVVTACRRIFRIKSYYRYLSWKSGSLRLYCIYRERQSFPWPLVMAYFAAILSLLPLVFGRRNEASRKLSVEWKIIISIGHHTLVKLILQYPLSSGVKNLLSI